MGSAIEWTDETWNPVTGCTKVSQGCKHCYAEGVADRFWGAQYPPTAGIGGLRPRRFTDVRCHPERLDQPLRWRKPRRVFVNSMSDLFHEDVPDEFILQVFTVMWEARQHTFQVLTKRPERMREWMIRLLDRGEEARDAGYPGSVQPWRPPPNVWLGVSVEDQATANERIPLLLDTPAAVRFVSYEPALGPVDFNATPWPPPGWTVIPQPPPFDVVPQGCLPIWQDEPMRAKLRDGIDWIIVGGESGPGARPFDLAWARSVIEQGRAAGVPVFVKQLGARPYDDWTLEGAFMLDGVVNGRLRDRKGGDPDEWPADLRVREFPA